MKYLNQFTCLSIRKWWGWFQVHSPAQLVAGWAPYLPMPAGYNPVLLIFKCILLINTWIYWRPVYYTHLFFQRCPFDLIALFLPCCYTLIYLYTTIPPLFHPSVLLSSLVSSYKKRSSFPDHNLVFYCLKNTRQMFIISSSFFLGKNSEFWAKPTVAIFFLSPATSSSTKTDSSYCEEQHR